MIGLVGTTSGDDGVPVGFPNVHGWGDSVIAKAMPNSELRMLNAELMRLRARGDFSMRLRLVEMTSLTVWSSYGNNEGIGVYGKYKVL